MQVQAFSIPIPHANVGAASKANSGASNSPASTSTQDTNSMFMVLLEAQLKNQSPLNPVDPMQFTSQLVQFNMLNQLTQINSVLQNGVGAANGASSGGK